MTSQEARAVAKTVGTQLQHEWMTTLPVLESIPESAKQWKPDDKSRSAWELAVHLAHADVWFLDSLLNGSFDRPERDGAGPSSVQDLTQWYKETMPAKLEQVLAMPDHKLTEVLDFYGMKNPAVTYFLFCLVHMVHHRGQLATYLRPMGGRVPSIYGGSADEPWPAQQ